MHHQILGRCHVLRMKFVLITWFAASLSVNFSLIHASFRMRNIRNKLTNKLCASVLKKISHGDISRSS
ncbi:hypothetical protein CEXT_655801 [Caerostris extrusa]|uniref:Secreted protein n=1 Tax=Caerostris extrusa TaxID=172846 RepID=A0AAV4WDS4_CAEEX|nr:hypothetical protein CEXT_655801 [Caerostris extrusa]